MSPSEAEQWTMNYYLHPSPERLVEAVRALAAAGVVYGQEVQFGLFDRWRSNRDSKITIDVWKKKSDASLIAFLSKVCMQNPSQIGPWLEELATLTERQQWSLWMAAWMSGVAGVEEILRRRASTLSRDSKRYVSELIGASMPPLELLPLVGPVVLDMLWSAFFATGDSRYVLRVFLATNAIGAPKEDPMHAMGMSALWSLQSLAKAHVRVREICAETLTTTTDEGPRILLTEILKRATE